MKATEVETKEDYILYLQSVIDDKDKVIENQIKKLLGLLANSKE
jgi:DNA-binding phage protein